MEFGVFLQSYFTYAIPYRHCSVCTQDVFFGPCAGCPCMRSSGIGDIVDRIADEYRAVIAEVLAALFPNSFPDRPHIASRGPIAWRCGNKAAGKSVAASQRRLRPCAIGSRRCTPASPTRRRKCRRTPFGQSSGSERELLRALWGQGSPSASAPAVRAAAAPAGARRRAYRSPGRRRVAAGHTGRKRRRGS